MKRAVRSLLLVLAIVVAPRVAAACDVADEYQSEQLRAFYTAHVRPILRPERRLPDGTAWRVIVDSVTGMAEARITWMADKAAMKKANRLLETLHACRLMQYWTYTTGSFAMTQDPDKESRLSSFITSGVIRQPPDKVIVSYASSRLVNVFSVDIILYMTDRPHYGLNSTVLDLERGRLVPFSRTDVICPRLDDASGQVGIDGLIDVCRADDQRAFEALWRKHAAAAQARAPSRGQEPCAPPQDDGATNRTFNVYITAGGLAVYSGYLWPRPYRECMAEETAANPVIIPWRELEPFLKSGPWRDELLKR